MHCTAQAFGYCPIRSNAILDNFATETTHPTGYVQASQVRHVQLQYGDGGIEITS
jgi:hypothetical protein